MINKIADSVAEALADIQDGATVHDRRLRHRRHSQ